MTLERQARQSDAQPWRPEDVFATSPVLFPWSFLLDARDKFDRPLERGDEESGTVEYLLASEDPLGDGENTSYGEVVHRSIHEFVNKVKSGVRRFGLPLEQRQAVIETLNEHLDAPYSIRNEQSLAMEAFNDRTKRIDFPYAPAPTRWTPTTSGFTSARMHSTPSTTSIEQSPMLLKQATSSRSRAAMSSPTMSNWVRYSFRRVPDINITHYQCFEIAAC